MRSCEGSMSGLYVVLMIFLSFFSCDAALGNYSPNALKILQQLTMMSGLSGRSPNTHEAPEITLGKKKHKNDSPIYYIKLPPLPYFYSPGLISGLQEIDKQPDPFTQLPVDFNTNGRPQSVYHFPSSPSLSFASRLKPVVTHPLTRHRPSMESIHKMPPSAYDILPSLFSGGSSFNNQPPKLYQPDYNKDRDDVYPKPAPESFFQPTYTEDVGGIYNGPHAKPSYQNQKQNEDEVYQKTEIEPVQQASYDYNQDEEYDFDSPGGASQYNDQNVDYSYQKPLDTPQYQTKPVKSNQDLDVEVYDSRFKDDTSSSIYSSPAFSNDISSFSDNNFDLPSILPLSPPHQRNSLFSRKPPITLNNKPLISIPSNNFFYNGKPSGIYVWKPPKKPKSERKYKHRFFKDFNY